MTAGLTLEGVSNFRDLGGAITGDGRRVASRLLFRSGSLHEMTTADRAAMEGLGITTVIDLRCEWERRQHPYSWPGADTVLAPLVDDAVVTALMVRFKAGTVTSEELEDWWHLVRVFQAPEEQASSIRLIFDTLLQAPHDKGVLVHCRGGKDRTGMVAAFILGALGVRPEDVMADFLRSNDLPGDEPVYRQIAAAVSRRGGPPLSPAALASLFAVKPEWLDGLFSLVVGQYGSVSEYLTDRIGIGAEGVARLQARYLELAPT